MQWIQLTSSQEIAGKANEGLVTWFGDCGAHRALAFQGKELITPGNAGPLMYAVVILGSPT